MLLWARTVPASAAAPTPAMSRRRLFENFIETLVVEGAGHLSKLVAELALVRRHAVRLVVGPRAPHFDDREVIWSVRLLDDVIAHATARGAVGLAKLLQRDDGVVLLRRDDVDVRHAVHRTRRAGDVHRSHRERVVEAIVGGRIAHRMQLLAVHLHALARRVPRSLV